MARISHITIRSKMDVAQNAPPINSSVEAVGKPKNKLKSLFG